MIRKTVLVVLAIALVPAAALAVDGVVLINQSTVMAAGGFPYTISVSGSYKLSGNLVVPDLTDGIYISQSNVTLDLNGFTISGGKSPQFGFTTLIRALSPLTGVTLRNGTLSTPARHIISITNSSGSVLEDLTIIGTGTLGFGDSVIVRRVVNPDGIINLRCPAIVVDSLARIVDRDQSSSTACIFGFNSFNSIL